MDKKNFKPDDYLSLKHYDGHPLSNTMKGFSTFNHDGEFYFALLDKVGKVFLRSEGYSSEKGRDNGMQSVQKNKSLKERWSISEARNHFFIVLKAGNHQEIGKSGSYKSKADAEAALAAFLSGKAGKSTGASGLAAGLATGKVISESRKVIGEKRGDAIEKSRSVIGEKRGKGVEKSRALGIEKSRSVIGEKRNVLSETKSKVKEDDYLKCDAYKGHKITDTKNRIATFKGEDGQYYFAVYYKDGTVRLRSEGFKTEAGRADELKACIEHMENDKMYSTIKKGKYFINVLKDKTGREVGRSCMSTEVQETVAWVAPAVAVAAAAPKIVKKEEVVAIKETPPPPPPKVVKAAPVVEPAAAASGCWKWWWLLLLLLIPILLWWLGCFAPKAAVAPVVAPAPVVVKKTPPPPPPPPAPKCECADLTHPIFKIPSGPAPKTTTALGRAPEYGNSHHLDPKGFYDKLNSAYKSSQAERTFLDGISKQLGFEGGWKDISPSIITAVTVPRGVSGNLGTKTTHQTVYRKLDPTNAKDLKAFKFAGKNACDLHFMKTCGNHFFFQKCE